MSQASHTQPVDTHEAERIRRHVLVDLMHATMMILAEAEDRLERVLLNIRSPEKDIDA